MRQFFLIIVAVLTLGLGSYGVLEASSWRYFGVTWVPTNDPTLKAWYRGDTYTDSAGDVTDIQDKSATGLNLTCASSRRPTVAASSLNGQTSFRGIASRNYSCRTSSTTALFTVGTAMSLVAVYKTALPASSDFFQIFGGYESGSNFLSVFVLDTLTNYKQLNFGRGGSSPTAGCGVTTYDFTAAHWMAIEYNGGTVTSTGSWKVWKNGVAQTIVTSGNIGGGALGTYIGEAAAAAGGKSMTTTGDLWDLWYNYGSGSDLDATDLANIASYMAARYAL